MFKDKHSYPKVNSITDSKILSLKKDLICAGYEHYPLYIENFLKIKENQDHNQKTKAKIILIFPQVLNWWRGMKSILNTNNKRREQKLNFWVTILANWKVTLQIFGENFNSKKYIGILNNSLDDFIKISQNDHIILQMDNCRVHWSLEAL